MIPFWGFPGSTSGKESACNVGEARDLGSILGGEDPLEKEMITHFSVFAWKIPWTEEPDRLLSMGSQRIWRDWETASTCMILFGQVPGSDHWVTENEPGRDLEYVAKVAVRVILTSSLQCTLPWLLSAPLAVPLCRWMGLVWLHKGYWWEGSGSSQEKTQSHAPSMDFQNISTHILTPQAHPSECLLDTFLSLTLS